MCASSTGRSPAASRSAGAPRPRPRLWSPSSATGTTAALADEIARGLDRGALQEAMRPGAARNALDCAFWDLSAKRAGKPVHQLAGLPAPKPLVTAYTISLAEPDVMAEQAAKAAGRALLKVKLGSADDRARIMAVRRAAPKAELIVDANEG